MPAAPQKALDDSLTAFIARQHLFFVASAPSGPDGHVNVSPKGLDTFRIIEPTTVAYLDLTGSGAETIAHVRDNGRLTIMFCALDGDPMILRLYGTGQVCVPETPAHDQVVAQLDPPFPDLPGVRAIIRVALTRVHTSCGFGIPAYSLDAPREDLIDWAASRGDDSLASYRARHNATSIDGLPAFEPATE